MSTPARLEGPCDEQTVTLIVDGHYSPALAAIGFANVPTLQRAVQRLNEAAVEAQSHGEPSKQYTNRALLCRARITLAKDSARASF